MSHPPKIPRELSAHKRVSQNQPQPRKQSFISMSLMVPCLPSALPSNQGLPVIRPLGKEKAGGAGSLLCSAPSLPLYQAGSEPPTFESENICLVSRPSLAVLQNPEHLDGTVHRKEGTVSWKTEMKCRMGAEWRWAKEGKRGHL